MTRMPLVSDWAQWSASSRQAEQRMKSACPSSHCPDCRLNVRGVEAMVKLATEAPLPMVRSSGSAVRLPMTVMTVSPAMSCLLT